MKPGIFGYKKRGGVWQTLKNAYTDVFGFGIFINVGIISGIIVLLTISIIPLSFEIPRAVRAIPIFCLILHTSIRWQGGERFGGTAGLIGGVLAIILYQQQFLILAFVDLMISFLFFVHLLKAVDNKFLTREDWKVMIVGIVGGGAMASIFWLYPKVAPNDSLPVFSYIAVLVYFAMQCLFVRVRTMLVAFSGVMFMITSAIVGFQAFQGVVFQYQAELLNLSAYLSVFFLILGIEHNYARDWKRQKKLTRRKRLEEQGLVN